MYIGSASFGPGVGVLGSVITLSNTGAPPYPAIITRGGQITEWSASFEALASTGVSIGTPATVTARLLYAPKLTSSPDSMANITLAPIDTMNLGTIPLVGTFQAYTGNQVLVTPITIVPGDYLLIQYYVDSTLVASVNGFHAQASVSIS